MRGSAVLLLLPFLLPAACRGADEEARPGPASRWAASLEGHALDRDGFVLGGVTFPLEFSLLPTGNDAFRVDLDGQLVFQLFDPVHNFALGAWGLDLDSFDLRYGFYYRWSASQPFGVLLFDDVVEYRDAQLGWTTVEFHLSLAPQETYLQAADTALLQWEATLSSQGTTYPPTAPAQARLRGTGTVAVRLREP
jgi:hypothetical protein